MHTPIASSSSSPFKNVIFDLGDVLFSWKPSPRGMRIPPLTFKHILRSVIWFDHEKGLISQEEAYNLISREYDISIDDVISSFDAARETLQPNEQVFELIREIKDAGFRIFAMSNISSFDCAFTESKADPAHWALFERVFTSAAAHERKPHLGFYSHVISEAGLDPARTIFVDDKSENVLTARSFGMHGIRFEGFESLSRQLRNLCGDPVERGNAFLSENKGKLFSTTSRGFVLDENYSQLLIWEATGDRDDLDCTAIGLTVYTHLNLETKNSVMDEIISLRTADGLVPVYFTKTRPRIDLAVCINVLTLFYRHNRGHELDAVLDWVYNCVLHGAYLDGTLYYTTPEVVLWFLYRLLQSSPRVRQRFEPLFKRRITERLNMDGNSLALAMRIIAAASVGIESPLDVKKLLALQQQDGSWTDGWFYKFPRTSLCVKNDGFATALAMQAIQVAEKLKNDNSHWGATYSSPSFSASSIQLPML
ncbi:HAD-like protein [Hysterangium stoloniferum]|nr:HAD-like protein [Hysterangium stoloniferum]